MLTGCISGNGGVRTRLAIQKYRALEACAEGENEIEDYFKVNNEVYRQKQRLGCPYCGAAKRWGIGPCRRCYRLRSTLRQQYIVTPQGFVFHVHKQFAVFAKTVGANRSMSLSQRINALMKWKPENSQN